ncbi:hypothetical protein BOX15_Mlig026587g3 [Macrostomum lignano]|uniref:Fibronectin type-III domain-containing protein n=1 Tax=Macrostomum lignano TaxID=282301 RepID=A0A267G8L9_9PLAT|nr:hypothetical protein BOX15_Mlig026587g3 [Macrostomum lignano]
MMKLLLCLLLATVQLLPPIVESGRSEGEARSQCIAACLKDFKARVSPQLSGKLAQHPHLINSECGGGGGGGGERSGKSDTDAEAVANCSSCTRACNWFDTKSFPRNSTSCGAFCQALSRSRQGVRQPRQAPATASCQVSCDRISQLFVTNPGNCPHLPTPVAGGNAADAIACRARGSPCARQGDDRDCQGGLRPLRCCQSECGFSVCSPANISLEALPPTPSAPLLRRPGSDGGVLLNPSSHQTAIEIDWSRYRLSTDFAGPDPVVFLMQVRNQLSRRFDAVSMATRQWRDLAVTSQTSLLIEELSAGAWYQFRLAAVNSAGFRAYSEASDPVKTGEPVAPRAPRGLREGASRIRASGWAADVQILWRPAPDRKQPDELPVAKYQLSWVEIIGQGQEASRGFDKTLSKSQTSFILSNLKLGATYRVTLAAIADYGYQSELRSRNVTIYVTTARLLPPTTPPTKPPPPPPPPPQPPRDQNDRRLDELGAAAPAAAAAGQGGPPSSRARLLLPQPARLAAADQLAFL